MCILKYLKIVLFCLRYYNISLLRYLSRKLIKTTVIILKGLSFFTQARLEFCRLEINVQRIQISFVITLTNIQCH